MKGMQKIKRGSGFAGVISYALDNDNGQELGQVIGGNMSGTTVKELGSEFGAARRVRPDVRKPVWHNSLRLPEGEKLPEEKWTAIADDYMTRMGFSDKHPRVYVLHDEPEGQHIHIVASRVALDGNLYLGKNENLISTKHIQALEKDYQLTMTKGPSTVDGRIVMPDVVRPKSGEVGKFERTEEAPKRFALAAIIDKAIADKPTATVFAERLILAGVEIRANFSKDKLNGFSFAIDGVGFKGSQLGKKYTGKALFERGLSYEQNRDYAQLRQYSSAAKEHAERDRPAGDPKTLESGGDRASHSPGSADGGSLWGLNRQGADRADPSVVGRDATGAGRDESPQDDRRRSTGLPRQSSDSPERGDSSTETHSGAKHGQENQPGGSAIHGAGSIVSDQLANTGSGIDSGVDVSGVGPMHTGDEATDNLLKLAYQGAMKEAQEASARQKRGWAEYDAVIKKRLAEAQATVNKLLGLCKPGRSTRRSYSYERPNSAKLSSIASRATDAGWRDREIAQFSRAVGASGFDLAFSDPSKKRGSARKTLTGKQLENSRTVRGLADYFARSGSVAARPLNDDAHGVILLTGLTAEAVQDLADRGFSASAVVEVAGKYQAWIRTDEKLTAGEREKLCERFSALTGVVQEPDAYGHLPGFSKGLQAVALVSAPGHSAPAAQDLLQDIRQEIQLEKTSLKLGQSALTWSQLDSSSYQSVGGIRTLRSGWFREARDGVQSDLMDRNLQVTNERIEAKILESMARQKFPVDQAYRAVFSDSRVCAGIELAAAQLTTHAYARVALEGEGKRPDSLDIEAEARRRFPAVFDRAESRVDSGLQAMQDRMKLDGQAEQLEFERKADEQRLTKAMEAAERAVQEHKGTLTKG